MIVTSLKTHKITESDTDILKILDQYILDLQEKSVVVVASKIVAICQGRMIKIGDVEKDALIRKEADQYLPRNKSRYNIMFTIKNNMLTASSGVDESNAFGHYILWPENLQKTANRIREHLAQKFGLRYIGVVISDSRTAPLRWGVTGVSLAHSGFEALENYMGKPDLFGRTFAFEKLNIADSLAASAVLTMGEGTEQTPLAILQDVSLVRFQDRNPTDEELQALVIDPNDDLYEPLLTSVTWEKGK